MRALLALFLVAFAGSAALADVPPGITVAKVEKGNLVMEVTKQVPVQKEVIVTVKKGEELVQEKRVVTVFETVKMMQQVSLKGVKATSGGKVLSEKALAERLAEDTAVVTSMGPIGEKYKKLFKDDAILIEFPAPPAGLVPPPPPPPAPKVLPAPKG